jgi:hypothetical protein
MSAPTAGYDKEGDETHDGDEGSRKGSGRGRGYPRNPGAHDERSPDKERGTILGWSQCAASELAARAGRVVSSHTWD